MESHEVVVSTKTQENARNVEQAVAKKQECLYL